ncbi:MAG: cytochrome c oxidase assembly factor 1 family protein [Thermoguttaceae bacterium]|jgi:hypothetical protein|nr:cytochrome c oxidase assembly factor 1 family protein [Thermoguttaceae bacterium]
MMAQEVSGSSQPTRRGPRRWIWLVVALAVLVGAGSLGWHAAGGKYKWTEPYRLALERVRQDPLVRARLGEPIRDATWLPSGSMTAGGNRETSIVFRVAGPQGTADVHLRVRQVNGQWGGTIAVMPTGSERIQLDLGVGDEAPKFDAQAAQDASKSPPPTGQVRDDPTKAQGSTPSPILPGGPDIRLEIPK